MRKDGRAGGWAVLLGALGLWAGVSWAEVPADALQAIDACVLKLNPDIDIGFDRVVARCPTLVRRLDESGWSVWLPGDWRRPGNDLSVGGLRELREVVSRGLTVGGSAHGQARVPSIARVPGILTSLARSEDEHGGWWARTKALIRSFFEEPGPAAAEGWFARMIGQSGVSEAWVELISYIALAVVTMLAVVIVANELRVGGVFGAWRRRAAVPADLPVGMRRDGGLTWGDVQGASLAQRPGVLLELVVGRLVEGGRLRGARGLTVGELTRVAQLADEAERVRLAALARTAERVRFSDVEVSGSDLATAVAAGEELLERIAHDDGGAGPDGGGWGGRGVRTRDAGGSGL